MKHRPSSTGQWKEPWSENTKENLFGNETGTKNATLTIVNHNSNYQLDVGNVLDKIHDTILHIR
jgi:hypothetical protein